MKLQGLNPTVSAVKSAVACEFGQGVALFDMTSNMYFSLTKVSAHVWNFLQEPRSVQQVRASVMERFDVDEARCKADIEALLDGLANAGLIRQHDEEVV